MNSELEKLASVLSTASQNAKQAGEMTNQAAIASNEATSAGLRFGEAYGISEMAEIERLIQAAQATASETATKLDEAYRRADTLHRKRAMG